MFRLLLGEMLEEHIDFFLCVFPRLGQVADTYGVGRLDTVDAAPDD